MKRLVSEDLGLALTEGEPIGHTKFVVQLLELKEQLRGRYENIYYQLRAHHNCGEAELRIIGERWETDEEYHIRSRFQSLHDNEVYGPHFDYKPASVIVVVPVRGNHKGMKMRITNRIKGTPVYKASRDDVKPTQREYYAECYIHENELSPGHQTQLAEEVITIPARESYKPYN